MAQGTLERTKKDEDQAEKTIDDLREELEILKMQDRITYEKIIGEIAKWASGAVDERRMTLYPSKTDDDFAQLLENFGEDLLSGAPSQESGS